jgi:capsular polysaccharide biosynthesis protein
MLTCTPELSMAGSFDQRRIHRPSVDAEVPHPTMNFARLRAVLARRWWAIVVVVAVAVCASLAHSERQAVRYEATATVFAHPSLALTDPKDELNELNLLSYGSILQTVADVAEAPDNRLKMATELRLDAGVSRSCSMLGRVQPGTTEILLSVTCGNRDAARKLADRLPSELDGASATAFGRVITLTRLDGAAAVPARRIQPDTQRNVVLAAVAGCLIGFVLAVLSTPTGRRPASNDESASPVLRNADGDSPSMTTAPV